MIFVRDYTHSTSGRSVRVVVGVTVLFFANFYQMMQLQSLMITTVHISEYTLDNLAYDIERGAVNLVMHAATKCPYFIPVCNSLPCFLYERNPQIFCPLCVLCYLYKDGLVCFLAFGKVFVEETGINTFLV